jgi:hypothetical protein
VLLPTEEYFYLFVKEYYYLCIVVGRSWYDIWYVSTWNMNSRVIAESFEAHRMCDEDALEGQRPKSCSMLMEGVGEVERCPKN